LNKSIKKILSITLPVALGVFLIWWSLSSLTDKDQSEIINAFNNANYFWVFFSLFLAFLSHVSRAYRWNFLLAPLGYKPRLVNSVFAVFMGYLINLVIPRAGEVVRATAISKYENIPFEKAFGTIVAERIIDVIMLLLIIIGAFFFQFDLLMNLLINRIPKNPIMIVLLGVFALVVAVLLYYFLLKSKNSFFVKVRDFFKGLLDGVKSILRMKKKWAFLAHTLFIWAMYLLMFYTVCLSIPETSSIGLGGVITGFVVGALSIAATNGGLGSYPVGVQTVLILYGIASNPALAFGWLMWSAQNIMILVFGGISFIAIPFYNKSVLKNNK
jgi:uncharacterized protein (TIRG00374 family)